MANVNLTIHVTQSREFHHLADAKAYIRRVQRGFSGWQVEIHRHTGTYRRSDGTTASYAFYIVRAMEPR